MMKKIIKNILAGIILSASFFILIELSFYLSGFKGNQFRSILFGDDINSPLLFEESPLLWWRLRKNANVNFLNIQHITDSHGFRSFQKRKNEKGVSFPRIICIGDSSTFGWRTDYQHTYPYLLEKKLKQHYKNAQVYNAGVPGYTSFQSLLMLKQIIDQIKPNIVIIYTSNNECSIAKLSDLEYFKKNSRFLRVRLFVNKSLTYQFLKKNLRKEIKPFKYIGKIYLEQLSKFTPRIPINDFESDLEQILSLLSKRNVKPILVTVPIHIRKPFELDIPSISHTVNLSIKLAQEKINRKDFEGASNLLSEAAKEDPYYYKINYLKGKIAYLRKKENVFEYENAIEQHPFPERIKKSYNLRIAKKAAEHKAHLIDLYAIFLEQPCNLDGLFIDQCHPSPKGYSLIADSVYKKIAHLLKGHLKD